MRKSLSPLECAVAQGLAMGSTYKWIASLLGVTENTARTIGKRAYAKAGVHSADELVMVHGSHKPTPSRRCYRIT